MNLLTNQNSLIACKYVTFTRALFDLSNKKTAYWLYKLLENTIL